MANIIGGERNRLVRQAIFFKVRTGLETIGWFDEDRQHLPWSFVQKEVAPTENVEPNIIGLADGPISDTGAEMGSILITERLNYYIDVYAQSSALGLHITGDIKAILQGRFTSLLGDYGPELTVYDYSTATPGELFTVEVVNIVVDKPELATYLKPWKSHYYSIAITVEDSYATEDY